MESLISQLLGGATGLGAYGLIMAVLFLCGLGLPIPEDFLLITGGYLVHDGSAALVAHGPINLLAMIVIAYVGILGGDSIAFACGHHFGHRLDDIWPFRLFITPAKRARVEHLFDKYGQKIIMGARFMPGVRTVTYFLAGSARVSYFRFLFYDGLAALVSAPVFVLLGWKFGEQIESVVKAVRQGQGVVIGAIVAAVVIWYLYRRRKKKREEMTDASG